MIEDLRFAEKIGLSIPEYGLCNLTEESFDNSDLYPEIEIDKKNCGLSFYSKKIVNTASFSDLLLKNVENKQTEKIMLFDLLLRDKDRHKGNIICSLSSNIKLYCIDCSHIFVSENYRLDTQLDVKSEISLSQLTNVQLLHENDIYDRLCRNVGYDENKLFEEANTIKALLDTGALKEIFESIPDDWRTENNKKRIDDILFILNEKMSKIDILADSIAMDRRNKLWKKC